MLMQKSRTIQIFKKRTCLKHIILDLVAQVFKVIVSKTNQNVKIFYIIIIVVDLKRNN